MKLKKGNKTSESKSMDSDSYRDLIVEFPKLVCGLISLEFTPGILVYIVKPMKHDSIHFCADDLMIKTSFYEHQPTAQWNSDVPKKSNKPITCELFNLNWNLNKTVAHFQLVIVPVFSRYNTIIDKTAIYSLTSMISNVKSLECQFYSKTLKFGLMIKKNR